MRTRWLTLPALILTASLLVGADQDCSFLNNPDEFMVNAERIHTRHSDITKEVAMHVFADMPVADVLAADTVPRKNFIDDAIFNRMAAAGIASSPLASDAEFLRRVTLDLTGRIPTGSDAFSFVGDTNPSKRDAKIDALIGSPEFIDKWTMFLGDLYRVNAQSTKRQSRHSGPRRLLPLLEGCRQQVTSLTTSWPAKSLPPPATASLTGQPTGRLETRCDGARRRTHTMVSRKLCVDVPGHQRRRLLALS